MEKQAQVVLLVALIAAMEGCSGSAPRKIVQRGHQSAAVATVESIEKFESDASAGESDPSVKPASERITALKPPTIRPAVMPEVVLTDAHAGDCNIRVGDEFPEFRLPDLSGQARAFGDVRGELLTVVAFWSSDRALTANLLGFLNERIAAYADLGVKVVSINVGDESAAVKPLTQDTSDSTASLLDPGGRLFSRVGRGHLPRVYLLDREGRVLWFDIEFSRHTREQLEQAIQASLKST